MVTTCIICKRKTTKGSKVTFHLFPTDQKRKQLWSEMCNLDVSHVRPTHRICSVHFTEHSFRITREGGLRLLKNDAVPSLFGKEISKISVKDEVELLRNDAVPSLLREEIQENVSKLSRESGSESSRNDVPPALSDKKVQANISLNSMFPNIKDETQGSYFYMPQDICTVILKGSGSDISIDDQFTSKESDPCTSSKQDSNCSGQSAKRQLNLTSSFKSNDPTDTCRKIWKPA